MSVAASTPEGSEAAERLHAERSCKSEKELIESSDVDIAHIRKPNAGHAEAAEAALRAGKATESPA